MTTAAITRPARLASPARVARLRRQALDLIANYRDVMAWGNDKLAAAFSDQECDAVTEVVNAAEDRALSAHNGYWRAIGRPGITRSSWTIPGRSTPSSPWPCPTNRKAITGRSSPSRPARRRPGESGMGIIPTPPAPAPDTPGAGFLHYLR